MAGPLTNIILNYSGEHYEKKITMLENYASQLEKHLNTLEGLKDQVNDFWQDDDAAVYLKNLTKQIISVRTAQEMVNNVRTAYTEAQSEIKKTKSKVSIDVSEISNLLKIVDDSKYRPLCKSELIMRALKTTKY